MMWPVSSELERYCYCAAYSFPLLFHRLTSILSEITTLLKFALRSTALFLVSPRGA